MDNKKEVVLMRGISGSGKSTYIKNNLNDHKICSADHYFINDNNEYIFDVNKLTEAHICCMKKYLNLLINDEEKIVVDNTNLKPEEYAPYIQVALSMDYKVKIIEVHTSMDKCLKNNNHGVTDIVLQRQLSNYNPVIQRYEKMVTKFINNY